MTGDEIGWKVAGVLGGLWLSAVTWIAARTESRIKDLEKDKASESSLERILARMEQSDDKADSYRDRIEDKLDKTLTLVHGKVDGALGKIADNSSRIARLEGRAEINQP